MTAPGASLQPPRLTGELSLAAQVLEQLLAVLHIDPRIGEAALGEGILDKHSVIGVVVCNYDGQGGFTRHD